MKVLFLDIDGVLNSMQMWRRLEREYPNQRDDFWETFNDHPERELDVRHVPLLNRITNTTGAKIVISSAWRLFHEHEALKGILKGIGVTGEIIGRTGNDPTMVSRQRGDEIREWLELHPEVTHFVILDDGSDMRPVGRGLVQTSLEKGLEDKHVRKAIQMLQGDGTCQTQPNEP